MQTVKEKVFRMRNKYTKDVVYSSDKSEKKQVDGMTFIQVFNLDNPNRRYFVNESAFEKIG